ncbi:Adenylate cyclase, class 3 [Mariprofundus ferrinatatus]|uniref:Adenylate cyclase, class 3 n=1 Tax=Mariprofundus ferrinatatus TaxID=1921087 RepID=A0A2K8L7P3_9PROT|nr:adenylate/guanylate cyclase domain-containing protein [Mariprofundus ferrinatatus]ATX82269.1 Adenylate cyclase, class 3 [Mariprofundus ferrinatatus]
MEFIRRFFWPFNVSYNDLPAEDVYQELRGICIAGAFWPICIGALLFYFGLSLTTYQQLLGLFLILPAGGVAMYFAGRITMRRDFLPIRRFLQAPEVEADSDMAAAATIQAKNFQIYSVRRILLFQAPAFAVAFSLMAIIANLFMGFGLELWQAMVALLVAVMMGIAHAIFEYYAVAGIMFHVVRMAHKVCGDLSPEQRNRVIPLDMRRKLLFVSTFVVLPPMIILGTTMLIDIRQFLLQLGYDDALGFVPGMVGWMLLVVTVGFVISLLIFLRMADEAGDSVTELSDAMSKVEEGNLNISLVERTTDEFADIYRRFNRMVNELMERERLRDAFGRYVARELADDVMQNGTSFNSKEVNASVLFADIRDFTAMSETMSAEEVVAILNEYFSVVEPTIKEEGGWINKFGGDSLLAVFGVLTPQPDHINHAVQAALKMRHALHEFNLTQEAAGKHSLRIGMGLHCGKMVAGSVGSRERMEFTVIGDTVNMASRIEGLNKKWGTDILISEDIAKAMEGSLTVEAMPTTHVHGKSQPIQVYAVK